MQNDSIQLWHALYETDGVGESTILKLMRAFSNPEDILRADAKELTCAELAAREQAALNRAIKNAQKAATSWKNLTKQNISAVSILENTYPKFLKEIPDPPPIIYYKGDLSHFDTHVAVAIVGTRKPTDYGRHVTQKLAEELARAGIIIVSGLALGLDAVAHRGALTAKGLTVAVLGNGLSDARIAPRGHLALSKTIVDRGGCLISEFPPHASANAGTFPLRNRIVAGLTTATIITEAAEKSGTLITARLALDYNRDVFAVPGSILSPLSQGANNLLKQGAKAITSTQDILESLHIGTANNTHEKTLPDTLSPEEKTLLNALSGGPLSSQELAQHTSLETIHINTHLTMLEINGFIRDVGNGKYIKNF